jgi:hypothetical protein
LICKTKKIFELAVQKGVGLASLLYPREDFLVKLFYLLKHSSLTYSLVGWFASNWQEKLEFGWELIFSIKSVGEIDSSYSTVGMDLHSKSFNIVGTIGSSSEIGQVELNLIPAFIKSHGHGTDEWLYSSSRLIVGGSESSSH